MPQTLFAEELLNTSSTVRLEFLDEKSFACPGLKRVLVMDPSILTVFKGSDRVTLKGMRVGKTSVVLWGAVRQTISVEVTTPPIHLSQQTERIQREHEEKHAVNFQVDYSFLKANQGPAENTPAQSSTIQHTRLRMDSPFVKNTQLGLSGEWNKEKEINALRFVNGTVSNITWPESQKYAVTFGNIASVPTAAFTEGGALQGVHAGNFQWAPSNKDQFNFGLTYGVQDKSQKNRFQNSFQNSSFLATPGTAPTDLISGTKVVEKKLARSQWRYASHDKGRQVFGLKPSSTLDMTHVFQDEKSSIDPENIFQWYMDLTDPKKAVHTFLGGTTDNLSYSGSYQQIIREFQFKLYHQNIPANTRTVNQNLFERKLNEVYLIYRPKADFGFLKNNSLTWDILQDNQKNNTLENTSENKTLTQRLEYQGNLEKYTLSLQGRRLDATESQNPQVATDYRVSLGRPFRLWRSGLWNISYSDLKTEPVKNTSSGSSSDSSTDSDTLSGFIGMNLWKTLNYSLSLTSTTTQNANSGEPSKSLLVGHSLSYQRPLWGNRVQSFVAYSYSTSSAPTNINPFETSSASIESQALSNQDGRSQNLSIGFSGNPSSSTLVRVNCQLGSDVQNTGEKRTRAQIETTVSSRFHTLFGWQPKNDILIVSFVDKDANGKFDDTVDSPLPNLEVLVNEKPFGKTDENGKLFLAKVRGFQKNISLRKEGTPEGYLFSTPSQYEITSQSKAEETCWFGFSINTEVSGLVYNDVNQNGVFDDNDESMSQVSLSLSNGRTTKTDLRGYYYLPMIPEGDYELKVNSFSLPIGYRSTNKVKRSFSIQKGSAIRQEFTFEAERVFKGILLRKTGMFTQIPISGVPVYLDGVEKTTDQKGQFKFTNLAGGKHLLRLSLKDIPGTVSKITQGGETVEASQEWTASFTFKNQPETQDQLIILE